MSQARHVTTDPTVPEYVPVLGHSPTQEPPLRNGVLAEVQLTQSALLGPEHVPHAAWHGWQMFEVSAYLAAGRQEARRGIEVGMRRGASDAFGLRRTGASSA